MKIDENYPLDRTHEESLKHHSKLMGWFADLEAEIAVWEPRPCPEDFQ